MKKYNAVFDRVNFIESKYGIKYAKTEGRLFKAIKVLFILSFAYYMITNLLVILGISITYSDPNFSSEGKQFFWTVLICSAVSVIGLVFVCCKLNISGSIISVLPLPFIIFSYANQMKEISGLFGLKLSFYLRHAAPIVLIAVFAFIMLIIAVREKIKYDKLYKKVLNSIYTQYNSKDGASLSDEEWDEIINNYNPRKNTVK